MVKNKTLLFLCTGNSCRSQMAEGWARQLSCRIHPSIRLQIRSAGLEAHGKNPLAVKVMSECNIDISLQESTLLEAQMLAQADIVVTVCANAQQLCPSIASPAGATKSIKIHWPIEDPAKATGTNSEVLQVFRNVRDEIRSKVALLINELVRESADV